MLKKSQRLQKKNHQKTKQTNKKMKKILFAAFVISAITFASCQETNAQSTAPRFGTTKNKDNTYRTLTNGYTAITDAAAADTSTITPNKHNNIYRITMTDSLYMASPVITSSYAGDCITLIVSGASGTKLKFAGTNFQSAGTATLSTGLYAVISFIFSGTKWVESARVVQ